MASTIEPEFSHDVASTDGNIYARVLFLFRSRVRVQAVSSPLALKSRNIPQECTGLANGLLSIVHQGSCTRVIAAVSTFEQASRSSEIDRVTLYFGRSKWVDTLFARMIDSQPVKHRKKNASKGPQHTLVWPSALRLLKAAAPPCRIGVRVNGRFLFLGLNPKMRFKWHNVFSGMARNSYTEWSHFSPPSSAAVTQL